MPSGGPGNGWWSKVKEAATSAATTTVIFVSGIANGFGSSMLGNAGRGDPAQFGDYANAAENGQMIGDAAAIVVGAAEVIVGATMTVGGGGATVGTGGIASPVSVPTTAAGVFVTAHGGAAVLTGATNLMAKDGANNSTGGEYPASPAFDENPYSPRSVSQRQSQNRRDRGVTPDPDTPIPDQPPGRNIKQGIHTSDGKTRHSTGERNVASDEEHSRVAKGNRGNRNNRQ